jgi:hypothetical protein
MNIKELSKQSLRNKKSIDSALKCGCYFCCQIFEPKEIKEWIDGGETALCPKCKVDSIIAEKETPLETEFLEKASKYWFW